MVRHQLAAEPHDDAAPDPDTEPAPDLLLSPLPEVLDRLDAVPDGLSEAESARRLARTGANELTAVRGASFVSDLVRSSCTRWPCCCGWRPASPWPPRGPRSASPS
jgi:hypothetical protein